MTSAPHRILVVTAVAAERDAVLAGRRAAAGTVAGLPVHRALTPAGLVDAVSGGVGPVAAAVSTGRLLGQGYDVVISAGIAGGFPPAEVGTLVVADAVVHADLGAETADGFSSMAELGWGEVRHGLDPALVTEIRRRTGARAGAVLTVSTATGSRRRTEQLLAAHPDALAEAMEGFGCYLAAAAAGVPFAELRAIANPVGPRQRESWRIADALTALTVAFSDLLAAPLPAGGGRAAMLPAENPGVHR
ncbi:futalosine hydrolase [Jatrophihabitans sp.]|uniref:futalosine hydrolase n=1 Tax=Jatrophihabitans sp. TaxID=1932789 RepID=UPI002CB0F685|nr:futalosine hydrolase [Jatrophihabitans sp.]